MEKEISQLIIELQSVHMEKKIILELLSKVEVYAKSMEAVTYGLQESLQEIDRDQFKKVYINKTFEGEIRDELRSADIKIDKAEDTFEEIRYYHLRLQAFIRNLKEELEDKITNKKD